MAHSLADWSLASTITLYMVQMDGEMRKSVDLLLLVSLDSNAILVLQYHEGMLLFSHVQNWIIQLLQYSALVPSLSSLTGSLSFMSVSHTHTHTVWRSSQSCHWTWASCGCPGAWQTPPRASGGPWWRSAGPPASRTCPLMPQNRCCRRPKHTQVRGERSHCWTERGEGRRGGCKCRGGCCSSSSRHMVFYSDHTLTVPDKRLLTTCQ